MELEFNFGRVSKGQKVEQRPFDILFLSNLRGDRTPSAESKDESIARRRIVPVDLDTAENLWSLYAPEIRLPLGPDHIILAPRDIDDFHPDHLYRNLPVFNALRNLRQRLSNPETAQSALNEVLSSRHGAMAPHPVVQPPREAQKAPEDPGDMFQRLLGKKSGQQGAANQTTPAQTTVDTFIHTLVAPHIVPGPDPRVDTAIDAIDLAISDLMRRILHHEKFQSMEASWRGLFDCIREMELNESLRLFVCDISRDELLQALPEPGEDLVSCGLFQLLVEQRRQAADDNPFSLIVGDFYFGPDAEDIALLTALGAAATGNGGTFLGGAKPGLLGCSSTAELADARYWAAGSSNALWHSLRTSPIADRIGLCLPRVLLRLPYGKSTEPIESFDFEEMPVRVHEPYLWGNPAINCCKLLAQSFSRQEWRMQPGDDLDLGMLPAHHYLEDGETRMQACTELFLSESTMVAMPNQGLMPLVSYRNQNTAVLARFQSIASPPSALAGPWDG